MQGTAELARTRRAYLVEIRDEIPGRGVADDSLIPGAVRVLGRSRLLAVESSRVVKLAELQALADPIRGRITLDPDTEATPVLDIFCHPGVTDTEGDTARRILGLSGIRIETCRAGHRYRFEASIPPSERGAVEGALGNPVIHRFMWSDCSLPLDRLDAMSNSTDDSCRVEIIPLIAADDEQLLDISRRDGLALDLPEMQAVRGHFERIGRNPTDVELESVALAWSEHCSHKTFKARIRHDRNGDQEIIDGLLAEAISRPSIGLSKPWVRSAFTDNAGIIAFDDEHDVAIKVETHNHPSAIEPFGGAHTGVGGVIRDVLAVSAEPIANTDVLCFGPLEGDPTDDGVGRAISTFRGVVRGIGDYGNNMGIPTVGGAVLFDKGYIANPLVFCGTVGIMPTNSHPTDPRIGDSIVLVGGRTGRDGLHGATMSSVFLEPESVEQSTVQIGAPITEKLIRDVLPFLREQRLYTAVNDCGAGGLCSAVGEMGSELGFDCWLDRVPRKYVGLAAWEVWLSEAQERMVFAVPTAKMARFVELCGRFEVEVTAIGEFRDHGNMRLYDAGNVVADVDLGFLHHSCPRRDLPSQFTIAARVNDNVPAPSPVLAGDIASWFLRLLAHPNVASKEEVIRRFDHEVGGGTVVKPLTRNSGPSDAAVVKPLPYSSKGVVIAHGINPLFGERDPRQMAVLAVDEALRNLTAVGGSIDRAVLLDNFSWGDVDSPEMLGTLVEAVLGCRQTVDTYQTPFVSGKDSLRNCSIGPSGKTSIPGTLLITAVGVVEDIRGCVTMDLKAVGSRLFLLGHTRNELAGSHLAQVASVALDESISDLPSVDPSTPDLMRRASEAIGRGVVLSCHDLSEGGLAVSAAEMALAGGLGVQLDLTLPASEGNLTPLSVLFSETAGRFLCEVAPADADSFQACMSGCACWDLGATVADRRFTLVLNHETVLDVGLSDVESAWRTPLDAAAEKSRTGSDLAEPEVRERVQVHSNTPVGKPRVLVLAAAGTNCDRETVHACRLAGGDVDLHHLNDVVSDRVRLDDYGALILPGGFSFGDHLGAGAVLAAELRLRLLDQMRTFAAAGRPIIGICNGFQVLARLGLLGPISLAPNLDRRFECRWVGLQGISGICPFVEGMDEFELPIAHGEGRLVVEPGSESDIVSRAPLRYMSNPNGSFGEAAAVCSPGGTILGLMPHPERFVARYLHPIGPSAHALDTLIPAGLVLFQNVMNWTARL